MEPTNSSQNGQNSTVAILTIVLELIKVTIWPAILVAAFLIYGDKLITIIENREIDAFGLKIGKELDNISQNYETQITQLKEEIKKEGNSQELLETVKILENNLDKQLALVKSTAYREVPSIELDTKKSKIEQLERRGFEAILNRDVSQAIALFSEAKALWPDYHNISEIQSLLIKHQPELNNPRNSKAWQEATTKILQNYSWGMPKDIREQFAEIAYSR